MLVFGRALGTTVLVLCLAPQIDGRRGRYYDDDAVGGGDVDAPLLNAYKSQTHYGFHRRDPGADVADPWDQPDAGQFNYPRREYRPYPGPDDPPPPAHPRYYPPPPPPPVQDPDDVGLPPPRRRMYPRRQDDVMPPSWRYSSQWADQADLPAPPDLHQDDADDLPRGRARHGADLEPAWDRRHIADLGQGPPGAPPDQGPPGRWDRPPARRRPEDSDSVTAKPVHVHVYLSLDQKPPPPSSVRSGQPPPPPRRAPRPSARTSDLTRASGAEDGPAAVPPSASKHIVINNYYHHFPAGGVPHDGKVAFGHDNSLAAGEEIAASTTDQPVVDEEQQQASAEPGTDSGPPEYSMSVSPHYDAATTTTTVAEAVEPLAGDLETYLGSDLRDADEARPHSAAQHAHRAERQTTPHAQQHADRKNKSNKKPPARSPIKGRPNTKRCFSIVTENKVKRYKETPC